MNLSILGSTGSIGRQTLELVESFDDIRITALAALKNIDLIHEQILKFKPEVCCVFDTGNAEKLKDRLRSEGSSCRVVSGMEGLIECATGESTDMVMISVVGMIGIIPTIEAVKAGKDIAQANKEPIVCAGHIIMPMVKKYGVRMIPVDSEHSAIYQCLKGEEANPLSRIWLTCSGGPFLGRKREDLKNVKASDALNHPSWNMGAKITIDSSTLVNKGLEVIEAHYLFGAGADQIQVAVQPGSIVHSAVEFEDGAVKAQLGPPDMKVPISYALNHERRVNFEGKKTLGFKDLGDLKFMEPDMETFKGLRLGYEACRAEGSLATVYNASNEECVAAFLNGRIGYLDIADIIEMAMKAHENINSPGLREIFAAEKEAREFARAMIMRV